MRVHSMAISQPITFDLFELAEMNGKVISSRVIIFGYSLLLSRNKDNQQFWAIFKFIGVF